MKELQQPRARLRITKSCLPEEKELNTDKVPLAVKKPLYPKGQARGYVDPGGQYVPAI